MTIPYDSSEKSVEGYSDSMGHRERMNLTTDLYYAPYMFIYPFIILFCFSTVAPLIAVHIKQRLLCLYIERAFDRQHVCYCAAQRDLRADTDIRNAVGDWEIL